MYSKITNPSVDAYDATTGKFLGEARFTLTPEAEKALLNWANYRVPPPPFVVINSTFEPGNNYVPIVPNRTYHQKGILRALFTQAETGLKVPIQMRGTYDWRARSVDAGTYITSAEYSNIQLDPLQETSY